MKTGMSLLAFGFLLANYHLEACDCARPQSIKKELASSAAVFEGKVESITQEDKDFAVKFEVSNFIRGSRMLETVVVRTADASGTCGYRFKKGENYLVYARLDEQGQIYTYLCTRTKKAADAETEIETLTDFAKE